MIPVLRGENGKTLRMGLDHGRPQFYICSRSGTGSWFMRIDPAQFPNGLQPGTYVGASDDGTERLLTISRQPGGMMKVRVHKPDSNSGREITVNSQELDGGWEQTLADLPLQPA